MYSNADTEVIFRLRNTTCFYRFAPEVIMQHVIPGAHTWNPQVVASGEVCFKSPFCQQLVSDEKYSHSIGGWEHVLYWPRPCVHSCSKWKQDNHWYGSLNLEENIPVLSVPSSRGMQIAAWLLRKWPHVHNCVLPFGFWTLLLGNWMMNSSWYYLA